MVLYSSISITISFGGGIEKQKRVKLTEALKLRLIRKLGSGVSVKVCQEYGLKKRYV